MGKRVVVVRRGSIASSRGPPPEDTLTATPGGPGNFARDSVPAHGDSTRGGTKRRTVVVARAMRPGDTVRLGDGTRVTLPSAASGGGLVLRGDPSAGGNGGDALDILGEDDSDDEMERAEPLASYRGGAKGETRLVPGVYHSVLGEPEEYASAARSLGLDHLVPEDRPVSTALSTPPDDRRHEARQRSLAANGKVTNAHGGGGGHRQAGFEPGRAESHLANVERAILAKTAVEAADRSKRRAEARESREAKKLPPHERIDMERQARALARFQEAQRHWSRFAERVAAKTGRDPDSSVMHAAADYREKLEDIRALGRAAGADEKGGNWETGLRGGGERFVRVGGVFSGLYVKVKEGMQEDRLEYIRRPRQGLHRERPRAEPAWKKTEFLRQRHEQLLEKNREEGYDHEPMYEALEVVGTSMRPEVLAEETVPEHAVTFTPSPAEAARAKAGAVIPLPGSPGANGRKKGNAVGHHHGAMGGSANGNPSGVASAANLRSMLKTSGSTRSLAVLAEDGALEGAARQQGPSLLFGQERLTLESLGDSVARGTIRVRNNGSVAVHYEIRRVVQPSTLPNIGNAEAFASTGRAPPSGRHLHSEDRFHLPVPRGAVLPGDTAEIPVCFTSTVPGLFPALFTVRCEPPLTFGDQSIRVTGIALPRDDDGIRRLAVEDTITEREAKHAAEYVVGDMLRRVRTPPPPKRIYTPAEGRELLFERANRGKGLFYQSRAHYESLEKVFIEAAGIVSEQRRVAEEAAADAKASASKKKGGAGKKPSASKMQGAAAADKDKENADGEADARASRRPPVPDRWDGAVLTIRDLIDEIAVEEDATDDDYYRWTTKDLAHRLQVLVDAATVPPPSHPGPGTLVLSTLLSGVASAIPEAVHGLRDELGLPPFALKNKRRDGCPAPSLNWALGGAPPRTAQTNAAESASVAAAAAATSSSSKDGADGKRSGKRPTSSSSSKKAGANDSNNASDESGSDDGDGDGENEGYESESDDDTTFGKYGDEDPATWKQSRLIAEEEYHGRVHAEVRALLGAAIDKFEAICSVPEALRDFPDAHGLAYPFTRDQLTAHSDVKKRHSTKRGSAAVGGGGGVGSDEPGSASESESHTEGGIEDIDAGEARRLPELHWLYPDGQTIDTESKYARELRAKGVLAGKQLGGNTTESDGGKTGGKTKEKEKEKGGTSKRSSTGGKKGDQQLAEAAEWEKWRERVWAVRRPRYQAVVPWDQDAARFAPPFGPRPEKGDPGAGKKKGSKRK